MAWVVRRPGNRYLTMPYLPRGGGRPRVSLVVFEDMAEATLFADAVQEMSTPSSILCANIQGERWGDAVTETISIARAFRTASSLGADVVIASESNLDTGWFVAQLEYHEVLRDPVLEPLHLLEVCWGRQAEPGSD